MSCHVQIAAYTGLAVIPSPTDTRSQMGRQRHGRRQLPPEMSPFDCSPSEKTETILNVSLSLE